jgi:hypothetical protein
MCVYIYIYIFIYLYIYIFILTGTEGSRSHRQFVGQVEERGELYTERKYSICSNE